jgi:Fur family ferric uptake transcriptional regulator
VKTDETAGPTLPPLGRKKTTGRNDILAAVAEMEGHFDLHDLHNKLKNKGSKISRASLYRNLPMLIEKGILAEVEKIENHSHYERVIGQKHHDHLICLNCGATIEFYSPTLEMMQDEICAREQFQCVRHSLEIMGYCKNCKTTG